MKSAAKSSPLYYSAYPLKVLEQAAASAEGRQYPHLKAVLSAKTKTLTRMRVSPMVDPYRKKLDITTLRPAPSKTMEPEGREWFNHYE